MEAREVLVFVQSKNLGPGFRQRRQGVVPLHWSFLSFLLPCCLLRDRCNLLRELEGQLVLQDEVPNDPPSWFAHYPWRYLGDLYMESGQTLQGSFSAAAVDRLYRSQILEVNTRWKALAEIYTIHSFAPFSWDLSSNVCLKMALKIANLFC